MIGKLLGHNKVQTTTGSCPEPWCKSLAPGAVTGG